MSNKALLKNEDMKSKCYFDLNGNDESVIVAEIVKSDDIRDKVAARFSERLGYESNLAVVRISPNSNSGLLFEIVTVGSAEENAAVMCRELCTEQLVMLQKTIPMVLKERSEKQ